jgi:hypothetical protein
MANILVDATAFAVFDMQELSAETFDAGLESAADELAVVFFWGFECFNCEIAKKAMLAKPDAIRTQSGRNPGARAEVVSQQCVRASRSEPAFHAARRANVVFLLSGQAPRKSDWLARAGPVRSRRGSRPRENRGAQRSRVSRFIKKSFR